MNFKTKGAFLGLTLSTTRNDLTRAVLEGIAMNIYGHIRAFRGEGVVVDRVTAVGGLTKSQLMIQIFADVLDVEIVTVKHPAFTAVTGAAMIASVATGVYADLSEAAKKFTGFGKVTKPIRENHEKYERIIPLFEEMYQAQLPLFEKLWGLHQ
jgi:xylulokinase